MATNYGPPVDYAGFWARVAAYSIDLSIYIIICVAVTYGASFAGEIGLMISVVINILIGLIYGPVLESSARQATFGKSIIGLQVTDLNGNRTSFMRAFLRNLAKILSAIPLNIGFLLAAFTGRKQALHDMITNCLVVRVRPVSFFKALVATLLWFVISVVAGAAYFYFVAMPIAQNEMGDDFQEAMQSAMNQMPSTTQETQSLPSAPKPPPPKPVVAVPVPAAPVPSVPSAVPPVPAPAIPVPVLETKPEPVVTAVTPKQVKPPSKKRISVPRKPVKKPVPDMQPEPQISKPAPGISEHVPMDTKPEAQPASAEVPKRAPVVVPESPPIVAFVPDSESRIIKPKYNDVMTAVMRSDRDAVKELLDLGWWVDKPASDGMTPLMAAVMNKDAQMVQLLLSRGAFPSSQALKLARDKKDAATSALLEQWGAR